jgi:hypothetical protein
MSDGIAGDGDELQTEPVATSPLQSWVSWLLGKARKKHDIKIAKEMAACFEGVNFTKQKFTFNGGNPVRVTSGEDSFYEQREIDKAIDRLNKLIDRLAN